MREILFRGKRLDNGEWVEGSLALPNYQLSNDAGIFCEGCAWICSKLYELRVCDYDKNEISIGGFIPVDPSTVGQFTGRCDKNKVRIFEGDIACFCEENQLPCYCVIKYGEYSFGHVGFYTDWYKGGSTVKYFRKDLGFWVNHREVEVIGNIHNNPELLEGEG